MRRVDVLVCDELEMMMMPVAFSLSLSLSQFFQIEPLSLKLRETENKKQTICVVREFGAQLSARIAREERVRVRARRRRW